MMKPYIVHEAKKSYSMRQQEGRNEVVAPTTWGADWDYFSAANHHCYTLCPCLCCLQKTSIVTILPFQNSCPYESDQNLQFSYHMYGHYLFARADNDLILVIHGYEVRFMWWTSLEHRYLISVSCCFHVMFLFQECHCYFFPKYGILFASGLEGLIIWWWSEYSCLRWGFHGLHVLEKVFNFVCYKACSWWWQCCWGCLVWSDQYDFFPFYYFFFFFLFFFNI